MILVHLLSLSILTGLIAFLAYKAPHEIVPLLIILVAICAFLIGYVAGVENTR